MHVLVNIYHYPSCTKQFFLKMATFLVFHAAALQHKIFNCFIYPHIYLFDRESQLWRMETNKWKMLPFYLGVVSMNFICGLGLCLFQILKYAMKTEDAPRGIHVAVFISGVASYGFGGCIALNLHYHGQVMVCYINKLFHFEDQDGSVLSKRRRWPDLYHHDKLDLFGIAMNLIVVYLLIGGLLAATFAFLMKLDVLYVSLNQLLRWSGLGAVEDLSWDMWIFVTTIRWVVLYLGCLEICRTFSAFLVPSLAHCVVFRDILEGILSSPLSTEVVQKYNRLRILHNFGYDHLNQVYAMGLGTGWLFSIMANCFTILGWTIFPTWVCISAIPITIIAYFSLHIAFDLTLKADEMSSTMVTNYWPHVVAASASALNRTQWSIKRSWDLREFRRIIKSQRAITFGSGGIAKLNREARLSFFEHLMIHTINVLLLFKEKMQSMVGFKIEF